MNVMLNFEINLSFLYLYYYLFMVKMSFRIRGIGVTVPMLKYLDLINIIKKMALPYQINNSVIPLDLEAGIPVVKSSANKFSAGRIILMPYVKITDLEKFFEEISKPLDVNPKNTHGQQIYKSGVSIVGLLIETDLSKGYPAEYVNVTYIENYQNYTYAKFVYFIEMVYKAQTRQISVDTFEVVPDILKATFVNRPEEVPEKAIASVRKFNKSSFYIIEDTITPIQDDLCRAIAFAGKMQRITTVQKGIIYYPCR
ncbi:hypothetical protein SBV1_gp49 [Sulfolobales Beppu virus 1]|nr:hypothetical protein SBV1_gp49 [Sulfolobales Beppu virus 1]